eukprot:CAMPEP_0119501074 /NCGR_PEP_ID=MMETSP1344-20130328/23026_1 /TAXON_ID=236787 /ORGANISM="Florenciella parvula, Strain CCMP2471" /LENGTH=51 /DNA_ID=CAMNT_0007537213 /DNA_START=58 /DNA_END=213 /DNA_ORIENTATION=-
MVWLTTPLACVAPFSADNTQRKRRRPREKADEDEEAAVVALEMKPFRTRAR